MSPVPSHSAEPIQTEQRQSKQKSAVQIHPKEHEQGQIEQPSSFHRRDLGCVQQVKPNDSEQPTENVRAREKVDHRGPHREQYKHQGNLHQTSTSKQEAKG